MSNFSITDTFLREVLEVWCEINYQGCELSSQTFFKSTIWFNSDIRIDNKPFFFKEWHQKGIVCIEHLTNSKSGFLSLKEFREKYSLDGNFLIYYSVISSIKKAFKEKVRTDTGSVKRDFRTQLITTKKPSKLFYSLFIEKKKTMPQKSQGKWLRDCAREDDVQIDWKATYKTSALCTASTRLREFQFKFLHRITATNSLLYKINISDSSLCSFCAESEETILHLYWECPITAEFRRELTDFLVACSVVPRLDSVNMKTFWGLKGYTDNQTTLLLSHCLSLARSHIY